MSKQQRDGYWKERAEKFKAAALCAKCGKKSPLEDFGVYV